MSDEHIEYVPGEHVGDIYIGDIVQFLPDKVPYSYWFEGHGLVLSIADDNIVLLMFALTKINKKNFTTVEYTNKRIDVSVKDYMLHRHLKVVA